MEQNEPLFPVVEHFVSRTLFPGIRLFEIPYAYHDFRYLHLGLGIGLRLPNEYLRGTPIGVLATTSYCCKLALIIFDKGSLSWAHLVVSRTLLSPLGFPWLVSWSGRSPHWRFLDDIELYACGRRLLRGSTHFSQRWESFVRRWGSMYWTNVNYELDSGDLVYAEGPLEGTIVCFPFYSSIVPFLTIFPG